MTLAKVVDKFWEEREDYVKRRGFFSRASIWITAGDPKMVSYEWHKRYSVPATKVFGLCACLSCSLVLGCGQAERHLKVMKMQKTGKHTNLGADKTKKQSVICAAFAMERNQTQRIQAQPAGVLWTDEDFEYCKLDEYCQGNISHELSTQEYSMPTSKIGRIVSLVAKGMMFMQRGCQQSMRGWGFTMRIMIVLGSSVR